MSFEISRLAALAVIAQAFWIIGARAAPEDVTIYGIAAGAYCRAESNMVEEKVRPAPPVPAKMIAPSTIRAEYKGKSCYFDRKEVILDKDKMPHPCPTTDVGKTTGIVVMGTRGEPCTQ
jgi:hypothetical protein